MDTFVILEEIGYIRQTTPAGRTVMVNPAFYPLPDADLVVDDEYAAEYDDADYAFDIYEDECDYENDEY